MKYSIIIPCSSSKYLNDCLKSIQNLDYPISDFEVILVDNNHEKQLRYFADKYLVKYVHEPITGSYQARNTGANNAGGEILIFIDSDCQVTSNWLKEIDKTFDQNVDSLMGKILGINKNNIAEFEQKFYEQITHDFLNNNNKTLSRIDTRNFAIKKHVFEKLNGFNSRLQYGGDMEFGALLHEHNKTIIFSENVIINHVNEICLDVIIKKRIKQNYNNFLITSLHNPSFIKKYFPHLLAHQNNFPAQCLRIICKLGLTVCRWPAKIFINYKFFKLLNILAIKYGLLSAVCKKQINL
ncbi:MAG: glycosyltransferase [Patescibacteria group bacterium]